MENGPFEDVFPIENCDIPASYVSLPEGISVYLCPGIPTTIKTMGVNRTTIVYLRVLIIQIGSTIVLMVVEA